MTIDEIVDGFGNACLRAGRSNSGLSINASAGPDWENMQKWREFLKGWMTAAKAKEEKLMEVLDKIEVLEKAVKEGKI